MTYHSRLILLSQLAMGSSRTRTIFVALFVVCSVLRGFGLYLQHSVGLEPCPLCIAQRYVFSAIAFIALVAAVHGPHRTGRIVWGALTLTFALLGIAIAGRQSWLQLNPPSLAECGPGLEYMLDSFGLAEALPMIFRGAGDCSAIDWSFLGLSIANWAVVCFAAIAIVALRLIARGGR